MVSQKKKIMHWLANHAELPLHLKVDMIIGLLDKDASTRKNR